MTEMTVQDLEKLIQKMMKTENVKDYKVALAENSALGNGYLGEMSFVTVHTSKNGTKTDYHLAVKSAKKSDELRKQTPIRECYNRESFMYSNVFPIYEEFQKLKGIDKPFKKYPKCFTVSTEVRKEAVILQNIKRIGFDMHPRKQPMNLNHIHMVFTQYAKFHAVSLALQDQKPGVYHSITKNMTDVLAQFVIQGNMYNNFIVNFEHIVKLLEQDGHHKAAQKFDGMDKQIEMILTDLSNSSTNPSVMLHGDCWNNNFMFKYEGNDITRPIDMVFIDFQLTRVASPVYDLSYFLYCCSDSNILKNFDFILQAYHSALSDALTDLGSDPDKIFPFKKLKEHWREYGRYGLIMATLILKICLCDAEEAPDFADAADSGAGFENSLNVDNIKEQGQYDDRMKASYLHFAENFL